MSIKDLIAKLVKSGQAGTHHPPKDSLHIKGTYDEVWICTLCTAHMLREDRLSIQGCSDCGCTTHAVMSGRWDGKKWVCDRDGFVQGSKEDPDPVRRAAGEESRKAAAKLEKAKAKA